MNCALILKVCASVLGGALLLAACGGGSEEEASIPARAGAAEIGANGGQVDAVLEGGTTVALDVPAGAVTAATLFRIDPGAPASAGQLGEFSLTTNAEALLRPVTLTVVVSSRASAGPDAGLVLQTANGPVALGRPMDAARRITAELSFLPPVDATVTRQSASRERPLATGATELSYLIRLLDAVGGLTRISNMITAVLRLEQQGSIDNAIQAQMSVDAAGQPVSPISVNGRPLAGIWQGVVCPQQSFAVSALNTYNGVDVLTFRRLALDALGWTLIARSMNATLSAEGTGLLCANLPADFKQPVLDKLPSFIPALQLSLNQLNARTEYVQLLEARFPEVVRLEAFMQTFDLGRSVLNLIEEQMNRLRPAGFAACRDAGDQDLQRHLLQAKVGNPAFTAVIPFGEADIRADIQFCGMPLRWEVLDDNRQPVGNGSAGGVAFGDIRTSVGVPAVGTRFLVLHGPMRALMCTRTDANGQVSRFSNNEQLVLSVGPAAGNTTTEVGRLTPSNAQLYLESVPLEFDLVALRSAAAAIQPTGAIRLDVQRSGDFCGNTLPNFTAHTVVASLVLDFQAMTITTTALPAAAVGVAYTAQLAAVGGAGAQNWSANGLPAGLSLDAASGVISGTPTTAGTSQVQVQVSAAQGGQGSRTLTLVVQQALARVSGNYAGTVLIFSGGAFPVSATVRQSVDRRVISVRRYDPQFGFAERNEYGFELDPNGDLRFLGVFLNASVNPRPPDATDMPVWVPNPFDRWEGTLVGNRLTLLRFFGTVNPTERWELTRQ